jgi:Dolichyl-phosphate-mannose-protein mannosyltransferase
VLPQKGLAAAGGAIIALVLIAGIGLRLSETVRARLWLDEYLVLEIGSQPTVAAVAAKLRSENNPPLYFLLAHAVLETAGDPELALRLISALAGMLTTVLAAWIAWRRWGPLPAIVAAVLVALSAVAVHYSAEIRPFALLGLVTLLYLETLDRALARPSIASLALEAFLLVLATALHPYGAPLLFVGPAVCLATGRLGSLSRQVLVTGVTGAMLLFTTLLPILRLAPEANEYLLEIWTGHGPFAPVALMLRDLLPTSRWPSSVLPPADGLLHAAEGAAALLAAALAVVTLAARLRPRGAWRPDTYTVALVVLLSGNAAMAVLSSLAGRPVVVPGRFSVALVAPFALAIAAASRAAPAGRACAAGLAGLAILAASLRLARPTATGIRPEALAAEVLSRNATGPSLILTVGLSGIPLRYAFRRRADVTFRSYPIEIERHIGWWAPRHHLQRPDELARDAEELSKEALTVSRSGRRIFVEGADNPIAVPLRRALGSSFRPRLLNRLAAGLFELVPIENAPAGEAR